MRAFLAWLAALFARPAQAAEKPKPTGIDAAKFIAGFEGFRSVPYLPTPRDRPTIGYGTTKYPDGVAVTLADPPCTEAQALAWLAHDVAAAEAAVDLYVTVPINEAQRTALTSFVFNCGITAFAGSTMLRLLNGKRYGDACREFARWDKQAGIQLAGLTKRRAAEAALFGGHP